MNLFDTTQLAIERAMTGAAMRHTALSDNIANANTPGYTPKEVDFHSALQGALGEGREALETMTPEVETDSTAQIRADGSGFDIDQQAAKLAANGLEYQALVSVASARSAVMRAALGR